MNDELSHVRLSKARAKNRAGRCCLCAARLESGYTVTDDDGFVYCEECWQP